jgi:hypothetical protein
VTLVDSPISKRYVPSEIRFGDLQTDPSKAKKPHHRPKNAKEFASKYLQGFYSIISDQAPDAKADSKDCK